MEQYLRDAGFDEVSYVVGAAARGIMTARKQRRSMNDCSTE